MSYSTCSLSFLVLLALLLTLAMSLTPFTTHAGGPWYVATTGTDANDCLSPSTPCATLQGALDKPDLVAGDTIKVAMGTYTGIGDQVVVIYKDATFLGGWDNAFTAVNGTSTIDGQNVRHGITVKSGVTAHVDHFTVQNGSDHNLSGGGIANRGTLTVSYSTVTANVSLYSHYSGDGAGIKNTLGTLTVTHSTISNNSATFNAGGIENFKGTVTISDSTVTDNTAGDPCCSGGGGGGGLANYHGTMTVNKSTISNNRLVGEIHGSGIVNFAKMTLNNSTVSGNYDGPEAIEQGYGTLTLNSSTVAANKGNGVHVFAGSTLVIQNTLLANNEQSDCYNDPNSPGYINSQGYNLVRENIGCGLTNTDRSLDPKLGPLQDNGGPTFTHALLPGSPAIDRGSCGGTTITDQRDVSRPIDVLGTPNADDGCDIGAYEAPLPSADVVISQSDSPDPVARGADLTYTIMIHNYGPGEARSVIVSDTVPISTTFQSVTGAGWLCTAPAPGGTGTVSCTQGQLASGTTAPLTLVVHVDKKIADGTIVLNKAKLSWHSDDPGTSRRFATARTCAGRAATPVLYSPPNGAQMSQAQVLLVWKPASCVQTYGVIVRQDSASGPIVERQSGLVQIRYTTGPLASGHTYYWRVKACNPNGCTVSSIGSFARIP